LRYRFGNSTYQITCRETDASGAEVTVDGVTVPGGSLTLIDDGKTHAVVVDVHRTPGPCPPDLNPGRGEQVCKSE
jgi:hypothetical protein